MIAVASVIVLYLLVRFFWMVLSRRRREQQPKATSTWGLAFVAVVVLYNVEIATRNPAVLIPLVAVPVATTMWEVRSRHSPHESS